MKLGGVRLRFLNPGRIRPPRVSRRPKSPGLLGLRETVALVHNATTFVPHKSLMDHDSQKNHNFHLIFLKRKGI